MTSEYSKEHDPLGHASGALRVPQEVMRTYDQLRDYVKRQMVRLLSAEGRGEDAHLAHLATGEMVLPRRLLEGDPWLRTYLVRVFEDAGLDWRTHIVGGPNRINPATGLAEFDPSGERDEPDEGIGGGGYRNDALDDTQDFANGPDGFGGPGQRGSLGGGGSLNGGGSSYANKASKTERVGNALVAGGDSSKQPGVFGQNTSRNVAGQKSLLQDPLRNVTHVQELQNLVEYASGLRNLGRYNERRFGPMPDIPEKRNSSFGGKTNRNALYSDDYGFTPNDLPSSADNPNKPEYLGGGIRVPGVPGTGSGNDSFDRSRHHKEKWIDHTTTGGELNNIFPNMGPGERLEF